MLKFSKVFHLTERESMKERKKILQYYRFAALENNAGFCFSHNMQPKCYLYPITVK